MLLGHMLKGIVVKVKIVVDRNVIHYVGVMCPLTYVEAYRKAMRIKC